MKNLRTYLKPWMKMMIIGFLIKTTGTFLELLLPGILSRIIDEIVPAGQMDQIILWGALMVSALPDLRKDGRIYDSFH